MTAKSFNYYGFDKDTYFDCIGLIRATNRKHVLMLNSWFFIVNLVYLIFSILNLFGVSQERIFLCLLSGGNAGSGSPSDSGSSVYGAEKRTDGLFQFDDTLFLRNSFISGSALYACHHVPGAFCSDWHFLYRQHGAYPHNGSSWHGNLCDDLLYLQDFFHCLLRHL